MARILIVEDELERSIQSEAGFVTLTLPVHRKDDTWPAS